MGQLLQFSDYREERRSKNGTPDLATLLRQAVMLRKNRDENRHGIQITGFHKLKSLFEAGIADILIRRRYVGSDFFLCGNYISTLLSDIVHDIPRSWFVIDFILESVESGDPLRIKEGANVCFLICSVFRERSELRAMRYEDYEKMGMGLFHQYYDRTGAEIGYHMSRQYRIMVTVTDECIRTI
ncbi:MAG: hypothetical protein ACOZF0_18165 [Thermodesulfobacteriota bacterium]